MIETIKGFGVVHKQYVLLIVVQHTLKIHLVELVEMICHPSPGKEHLLILTNEFLRSIHHRQEEHPSYQTISSIIDRDGPGIGNFQGLLLREQEEGGEIKIALVISTALLTQVFADI